MNGKDRVNSGKFENFVLKSRRFLITILFSMFANKPQVTTNLPHHFLLCASLFLPRRIRVIE